MKFLDRVLGRDLTLKERALHRTQDEITVERYTYLLRHSPALAIEEVHIDAFSRLTPAQLDLLFAEFTRPSHAADDRPSGASAESLARPAARAELSKPGFLTRAFGKADGRWPGLIGLSLDDMIASYAVASVVVSPIFWTEFGLDAGDESLDAHDF